MVNQEKNPNLQEINIFWAGKDDNAIFSSSAKEHIAALRAKGLTIAETFEQYHEMSKRYHPDEYAWIAGRQG